MKKVFNYNLLWHFLILIGSFIVLLFYIYTNQSYSTPIKSNAKNIPIKRPLNLFNFEESADTIFNLVQKVGGKPVANIKKTRLKKNENLSSALKRINFENYHISKIIKTISQLNNGPKILSSLPAGMIIEFSNPSSIIGGALKLNYTKTKDIFVWQDIKNNYFSQVFLRPTRMEETLIKGVIKNNLYISALKSGIPENTLLEMISLLGFSVDFQREIRSGDSFEVLFTKEIDTLNDLVTKTKPIKYVSMNLSGNKLNFFKYYDKYGLPQYYDEKGKSSKRTLMKTPINGARLSSRYGNRKHPILGYTKMHRGLDFAAPSGTPVFAAGDGIIEKAGWNGSYGKYIRIKHTGIYKTAYAHLSGIHNNVRIGKRVLQGKIIGYVGTTGRSTGPHLHYEVIKNNIQVNPMRIKLPAGKNISKANIKNYKNHVERILKQKIALEKLNQSNGTATNKHNISTKLVSN